MEHVGIPVKHKRFERYQEARPAILQGLVRKYDPNHEIWNERFEMHEAPFLNFMARKGIPWDTWPSGQPVLTDEYFKNQADSYDEVKPIAAFRSVLKSLPNRKKDLQIGADGFARCILSAFRTKTGRTHPDASQFIFGRAGRERRRFLGPPKGYGISYIDYTAQEIGVVAVMSHDDDFWGTYLTGDIHWATAVNLGMVPANGKPEDYDGERKTAKQLNFAILYGSGPVRLAARIPIKGFTAASAAALIQTHRVRYPVVHAWIEDRIRAGYAFGEVCTRLGWRMLVNESTRPNTLRNWFIQATAGEITREAVCQMTECGIQVCCPVHDAVLIISREDQVEQDTTTAINIMVAASEMILGKPLLIKRPKPVFYPDTLDDGKQSKIVEFVDPYLLSEDGQE
jgi:DNA polymerase I